MNTTINKSAEIQDQLAMILENRLSIALKSLKEQVAKTKRILGTL